MIRGFHLRLGGGLRQSVDLFDHRINPAAFFPAPFRTEIIQIAHPLPKPVNGNPGIQRLFTRHGIGFIRQGGGIIGIVGKGMNKASIRHSVFHHTVQQAVAVLDKADICFRINAQTTQGHRHLTGAFKVLRSPAGIIAIRLLCGGKPANTVVYHLSDRPGNGLLAFFQLICIGLPVVIIGRQRLHRHSCDVRIRYLPREGKASVRHLLAENLLYDILPRIISPEGDWITHTVQRDEPPDPAVDSLPS